MADPHALWPPGLLAGRIALVTGAGQGNGRAIAIGLASAGARIIVTDIHAGTAEATAAGIRKSGGAADAFQLDVTDAAACHALAARTGRDIGPVAILVNNAGIIARAGIDSPEAHTHWHRIFDVNVHGTFHAVHAWLPALRATKGTIINLASIASFAGIANSIGYAPSKGAIKLFTQALARDLAPDGIRVNAIAPGVIATPMTEVTRSDPERLGAFLRRIPMNRVGEPEELVGPVVFLAPPMASYVTGVTLAVDGGYLAG
jgi:NAD(P)-dependent dehydrogenase (short-subunit alcohol dehydrogenase family)